MEKRKWVYVQQPSVYGIAACECGNHDTQWSEFEKHIWCSKCEIDFIPAHGGIFDGPIPVNAAKSMGICFDRINLETHEIEKSEESE